MQIPPTGASPYAPPTAAAGPAASPGLGASSASDGDSAVQDFLNLVGASPAQQMRNQILRELGVTQDQLNGMDPKDRAKIEEKIKEMIREKVEQATEKQTGVAVDLKV